jgi:hypothetical protein
MPKYQGLLLVEGGAPNTPHVIEGLPGFYFPEVPHPAGEGCDLTLEDAKAAVKRLFNLKLVEIKAGDLEDCREIHAEAIALGRNELVAARRDGRAADDPSRTKDHHDAVKEA